MTNLVSLTPEQLVAKMGELGIHRACFVRDPDTGRVGASHPELQPVAEFLAADRRDFHDHEGVFLEVGAETGALHGAFVHDTRRGQGAGGVRYWPYDSFEGYLRDGLRLARGMTRKNALAGLWWGGGKGVIARQPGDDWRDRAYRDRIYAEYGRFMTSLRGCYVTAEDAGTTVDDMRVIFAHTRFTTCIPAALGGSGNPSEPTAKGVVCAMEAALDSLDMGTIAGKTVAMQGAGNVAGFMIDELLARGAAKIVATEINDQRRAALLDRHAGKPVEIREVAPGDDSILAEPCDIVAPNALGGVLGPDTIPTIRARIVCGAANNQLLDEPRDAAALTERGICYVPDFVCNRMGIVNCANEQYGYVTDDPAIERHFGRDWDNSVFHITQEVLRRAKERGIPTAIAANELADEYAAVPHPIWGHRQRDVIRSLVADGWAQEPSSPG